MLPFTKTYKSGAHLFHENDHSRELYILQAGKVRVYRKIGAKEVELAVLSRGAVLGEMALIDGKPRSASAVACADCIVILIDADTFHKRIAGVPSWYLSLIRTASEKIRKANARLQSIQATDRHLRGILALSHFFQQGAAPEDGGAQKCLDIQKTAGFVLGLCTVSARSFMRVLESLQQQGIVELTKKYIRLVDEQKLKGLCDYVRLLLRKSFEKMPEISPCAEALIRGIQKALSAAASDKGIEAPAAEVLSLISKCDPDADPSAVVEELTGLGVMTVKKGAMPQDKAHPLSGCQFFVDPEAFEKYFLYCTYRGMVAGI
jgi:CRP-like cAMP-binding protein